jgi:Zn-dependent M16 (insulinase) family peptidase
LTVADIPRTIRTIPWEAHEVAGITVDTHPVFANGVGYVSLAFDVADLDDDHALLLPLVGRATTGMGAGGWDYETTAKRIARYSGGFATALAAGQPLHGGAAFSLLTLDVKLLPRNIGDVCDVLRAMLLAPDTDDLKRLGDLVREAASRMSSSLIPSGSQFALTRAAASLALPFWRREQWTGVTQLRHLRRLMRELDQNTAALAARLAALQAQIFTRARLRISLASDPDQLAPLQAALEPLIHALPAGTPPRAQPPCPPHLARHAGVALPAEVNYVAQILPVPVLTEDVAPALGMLAAILSSDYLYKRLRVEGGAYGAFAAYMGEAGLLGMMSYRDPQLEQTLAVFANVLDYIDQTLDDEAVAASRIGTIGRYDRVLAPAQQLEAHRSRRLYGITDQHRQAYREGLLAVDAATIRARAIPYLSASLSNAPRAALASRERLEQANTRITPPFILESID